MPAHRHWHWSLTPSSEWLLGLTAAFAKGWDMTLVICAVIPLLAIVAGSISVLIGRVTSQQSEAYGVANGIASEALAAIRTVLSFNGEDRTVRRYGMSLNRPLQVGIKGGLLNGIVIGFVNCIFLCAYALALWYGGTRVRAGKYTGKQACRMFLLCLRVHGTACGCGCPQPAEF